MNNNELYHALNNLVSIDADYTNTYDLTVENDSNLNKATINDLIVYDNITMPPNFIIKSIINQPPTLIGTNQFVNSNFQENIYQSGGSSQFKDCLIGTITQNGINTIIQSGTQWNYLKSTQITNLEVLGSLTIPSGVTIPGATYNSDLVLINNATIQQQTTSYINTLSATDFFGNIRCNYNIIQVGGASTYALLKNLTVEGNSTLGPITSPTITLINTNITNLQNDKLDKNGGIATSLSINGISNYLNGRIYCSENYGLFYYLNSNGISNPSCAFILAGYNAMITDLYSCTDMRYRFVIGGTTTIQHQFNSNGSVMFKGIIDSPTITSINTQITTINTQITTINTQITNLQTQVNNLPPPSSLLSLANTWTNTNTFSSNVNISGISTFSMTRHNSFAYFVNTSTVLPTTSGSYMSCIGNNFTGGHGEMDIWNTLVSSNLTISAFDWYSFPTSTTTSLLMRLLRNGNLVCYGGITIPVSQNINLLGGIIANSITITPIVLSRISNLSSDCQTQLTNLANQDTNLQTQINARILSESGSGNNLTLTNSIMNSTTFNGTQILSSNSIVNYYLSNTSSSGTQFYINSSNNYIINHVATNFMMIQWGGTTKHHFFNDGSLTIMSLLTCNNITCSTDINTTNLAITGTATGITKSMVGLSNVDNTSDISKPISTLTQNAINLKANIASPSFTGYTYFSNIGNNTTLTSFGTGNFGAICSNLSGGNAEMDFINTGFAYTNPNALSFVWYLATSQTTRNILGYFRNNGNFNIAGNFTGVQGTFTGVINGVNAIFSSTIQSVGATFTSTINGTNAIFSSTIQAVGATFTNTINGTNAIFSSTIQSAGATFTGGLFGTSGNFSLSLQAAFLNITGSITSDSLTTNNLTINNAISGDITVTNNITSNQGIISGRYFRGLTALQTSTTGVRYKWFDNAGTEANLPTVIVLNQNTTGDFIVYLPNANQVPDLPADGARTREGISVKIYFWVARYCQVYNGNTSYSDLHLPGTDSHVYGFNGAKSQCIEFMVLRPNASSPLQWCLLN